MSFVFIGVWGFQTISILLTDSWANEKLKGSWLQPSTKVNQNMTTWIVTYCCFKYMNIINSTTQKTVRAKMKMPYMRKASWLVMISGMMVLGSGSWVDLYQWGSFSGVLKGLSGRGSPVAICTGLGSGSSNRRRRWNMAINKDLLSESSTTCSLLEIKDWISWSCYLGPSWINARIFFFSWNKKLIVLRAQW